VIPGFFLIKIAWFRQAFPCAFLQLILFKARPLQNAPFCSISASNSNLNPRDTQCSIPVVKIIAFLELKQKLTFFKGLEALVK
jgi:hypothetical protein